MINLFFLTNKLKHRLLMILNDALLELRIKSNIKFIIDSLYIFFILWRLTHLDLAWIIILKKENSATLFVDDNHYFLTYIC